MVLMGHSILKILCKKDFENRSYQRLNEEELCKERKGEIEANELQPVSKQSPHIEACLIVIIEKCGNEAHSRAHNANCCADDGSFKQHGMGAAGVEILAGEFEGQRRTQKIFQCVCQHKLDQNDGPDRYGLSEHGNAAHLIDRGKHAGFSGELHKHTAVDNVQAEKDIRMDCDHDCDQGEDHSLKLISWHHFTPFWANKKHTHINLNRLYRNQIYALKVPRVSLLAIFSS